MADRGSRDNARLPEGSEDELGEREPARLSSFEEVEMNDLSSKEEAALNRVRDRRHDYLREDSSGGEKGQMLDQGLRRRAPLANGEVDLDDVTLSPADQGASLGPPPPYPGTWKEDEAGGARNSGGAGNAPREELEMMPIDSAPHSDSANNLRMVEEAPVPEDLRSQTGDSDYQCVALGPLNPLGTAIARGCLRLRHHLRDTLASSPTRIALAAIFVCLILAVILFLGLFPPSVITVEYYQVALKRSKISGAVDRSDVLMSGCHVLTPDVDLVIFNATGQVLSFPIDVFTIDSLVIEMDMAIVYFLKPEEIGKLHSKFEKNYEPVFLSVIKSTIKNAAMQFDREDYRLRRREVEQTFFSLLHRRLGGDCCPSCCPSRCSNGSVCALCRPRGDCDEAYHADVLQVYLMDVNIPDDVQERYMQRALLQVGEEREVFIQQQKVTEKQTMRETSLIKNAAAEKEAGGRDSGYVVGVEADAGREVVVGLAYVEALRSTFSLLNISNHDHKASLIMIRGLEDSAHNLYSYNYHKLTGLSP